MIVSTITIVVIFVGLIIGKFIVNPSLQSIYWLLMFLLFVSILNIYTSIHYYVKLRTEPGIQGDRGDPGDQGEDGNQGTCVINTQCNAIQNCRDFLQEELGKIVPEYKGILEKENNSISLNDEDEDMIRKMNHYINILEPKCKSGLYTKEELRQKIVESFNL